MAPASIQHVLQFHLQYMSSVQPSEVVRIIQRMRRESVHLASIAVSRSFDFYEALFARSALPEEVRLVSTRTAGNLITYTSDEGLDSARHELLQNLPASLHTTILRSRNSRIDDSILILSEELDAVHPIWIG